MDGLESIMAHEVSDRERQTIDNLTYVWNLKKTTQKQSKLVVARDGSIGWAIINIPVIR